MSDIIVDQVTKTYGSVTALDNVSLNIPENASFGLLGTNGAGKTTLFKLLIGHEIPDSGYLEIAGLSCGEGADIRQKVGYVPEKASFPDSFTGREALSFHADIREIPRSSRQSRIDRALELVGLDEDSNRRIGGYSKGMNRRLGLATVLISDPEVLLLDEPTSGLDPKGVESFHDVIRTFSERQDLTMVFSSHTLAEIDRLCDQVAILHEGQLKRSGQVDDLRTSLSDSVTVDVWPSSSENVDKIERELDAVDSFIRRDGRLRIECSRSDAYEVLRTIHDHVSLENFEVRQPGIEDVFLESIRNTSSKIDNVSSAADGV